MALTEKELKFIEQYRRLSPDAQYALKYVIENAREGMTIEEMKTVGDEKIAEYNSMTSEQR